MERRKKRSSCDECYEHLLIKMQESRRKTYITQCKVYVYKLLRIRASAVNAVYYLLCWAWGDVCCFVCVLRPGVFFGLTEPPLPYFTALINSLPLSLCLHLHLYSLNFPFPSKRVIINAAFSSCLNFL